MRNVREKGDRRWSIVAAVLLLAVGGLMPGAAADPAEKVPGWLKEHHVADVEADEIAAAANDKAPYLLDVGARQIPVRLDETSIYASDVPVPDGVRTYAGEVVGKPGSIARLTVWGDHVQGLVQESWGNTWWIDPLSDYDAGAGPSRHLVFRPEWVDGTNLPKMKADHDSDDNLTESDPSLVMSDPCLTSGDPCSPGGSVIPPPPPPPITTTKTYMSVKTRMFAMQSYANMFPDWIPRLTSIVNSANGIAMAEAGNRFELQAPSRVLTPMTGTWSTTSGADLVNQLYWRCQSMTLPNDPCEQLEVAHLASSYYIPCGGGCTNGGAAYFHGRDSWTDQAADISSNGLMRLIIFLHETGHNLGADHSYAKGTKTIMEEYLPWDAQPTYDETNRRIMRGGARESSGPFNDPEPHGAQMLYHLDKSAETSYSLRLKNWRVYRPLTAMRGTMTGNTMELGFEFWNEGTSSITGTLRVGCRRPYNPNSQQANSCDFSQSGAVTIPPGGGYGMVTNTAYAPGGLYTAALWDFWPAFKRSSDGAETIFRWAVVQIPVQAAVVKSGNAGTSTHNVQVGGWVITSPATSVKVGMWLTATATFHTNTASSLNYDPGAGIACKDPNSVRCDSALLVTYVEKYKWFEVIVSFQVTKTGTWKFWPTYTLASGAGSAPNEWLAYGVSVT